MQIPQQIESISIARAANAAHYEYLATGAGPQQTPAGNRSLTNKMYMKKVFLALAVLCAVGMMAGCKGSDAPAELDETTATETANDSLAGKINLYNANGKKDGLWLYEVTERMISEVNYCNGNECGEQKVYINGKLNCHITGIEKTDTVIGLNRFEYKAHYKEYTDDGSTINKEGDGFYTGYMGIIIDGFLGVGDWRVYDTLDNTYKTVTLDEPAFDESIRIKSK